MQHELLGDHREYKIETYAEVTERYDGFGKEIYGRIQRELPEVFARLTFYQATKSTGFTVYGYQPEDSYAVYEDGADSFAIQLEPLGEVICLWKGATNIEIGYWSDDEYTEAMNFIKANFIKQKTPFISKLLKLFKRKH